jgi:tetratricopeptide (TPR) repeat protein
MQAELKLVLTLARSGATQRAWEEFVRAGLAESVEVGALTLKGRLLKDRARDTSGAEQTALFAQAGVAYQQAAKVRPDSYPLINAAALSLFSGDSASAAAIARDVLTLVDTDPSQGETPYWRAATRAEALLLLGRVPDAESSLSAAIRLAPQAYEDHAATLRQFASILEYRGQDNAWLDPLRPRSALHFSGIMGIAATDPAATAAINQAIAAIDPGFGYGALAAGADIIVAEALIARGCELHVVLPCTLGGFRMRSVESYSADWLPRFDALIAAATTVTCCSEAEEMDDAAINLSDQVAMGMAIEQTTVMECDAVALRITPAQRSSDLAQNGA